MAGVIELTGKYIFRLHRQIPIQFFSSNRYIMVMHDYDINAVLMETMKIFK